MKKNILSILILALLVVNIVLTSVMMLTVTSSSKKTANLVTQIATILDLELASEEEEVEEIIPMENITTLDLAGEMTIPLAKGEDGASHYCLLQASLVMNTKDDGYKKYGETIQESLIRDIIIQTVSEYTLEEFNANTDEVKAKIVEKIQAMYDSEFIFKVAFGDYQCQ
ncbi:MAG: flagellar basal body-associated FliL family protein [Lachnospiraceae bacterium]|nr:flagellar basal body-associated FliL family protein [Lachnospiraceae bacterium]